MTVDEFCQICGFTTSEQRMLESYLADEEINRIGLEICRLCFATSERPDPLPEIVEGKLLPKANFVAAFYGIEYARKIHAKLGLPEYVLENGMRDLAIWARHELRDKGVFGIKRGFRWTNVILRAEAIRLGRLECNLSRGFRLDELRDANGNILLKKDDPLIGMHIPADGPLNIDDCLESMRQMAAFFERYRPDYHYKGFVMDSWLLDPQLIELLPPDSNIVKFQQLGIHYHIQDEYDLSFWIWGTKDPEKIENPSTLQRNALAFLKSGRHFQLHGMYIPKEWIVK